MDERKKIIYGGSFNPPTIAHYEIALFLMKKFQLDLVFVPTGDHYCKNDLISSKYRIAMLKILVKELNKETNYKATISKIETKQKKFLGTYYTMKHFCGCYLAIGADNFLEIDKWINYEEVIEKNRFIVIPREGYSIDEFITNNIIVKKYLKNFYFLDDFSKINVSSSMFRKNRNKKVILDKINKYIIKNNLYKE